jgi:hypothetical protein
MDKEMRRKGSVKEGYEGEEAYGRRGIIIFGGFSWICWFRV